jgi:hypothetical protein
VVLHDERHRAHWRHHAGHAIWAAGYARITALTASFLVGEAGLQYLLILSSQRRMLTKTERLGWVPLIAEASGLYPLAR